MTKLKKLILSNSLKTELEKRATFISWLYFSYKNPFPDLTFLDEAIFLKKAEEETLDGFRKICEQTKVNEKILKLLITKKKTKIEKLIKEVTMEISELAALILDLILTPNRLFWRECSYIFPHGPRAVRSWEPPFWSTAASGEKRQQSVACSTGNNVGCMSWSGDQAGA